MESDNGRELLENVVISSETDAPQYIRLSESSQIELLQQHNGLVVDLAGNDFIPVTYSSEDLLPQELTEEDRNLAAALVAVQLSQQQKQQQMQDASLPLVGTKILDDQQLILTQDKNSSGSSYLRIVNSDNLYVEQPGIQKLVDNVRMTNQTVPQGHFVEEPHSVAIDISKVEDEKVGDSDQESIRNDQRTLKKSLPHKKRISRKLRKNSSVSVKKFSCTSCDHTFDNDDECAEHEATCQTAVASVNPSPFSCQLCNAPFEDQLKFFEHLKKHYEPGGGLPEPSSSPKKSSPPPKPEKKPPIQEENQPQETLLSSLLSLTCIECNKTFRRQKTFEAHMRDVHTNKNEPVDEFSDSEDVMAGISVVVDDDIPDDNDEDDSKAWYREEDLHQTEEDLKELEDKNEHVCHLCKQPFALRAILLQHLVTCRVISGNTEPTPAVIVRKKNKRIREKLTCSECDRIFKHRNSLVYHMRSHTGIRPHQCELCGKSFFSSSALKVHLRLHSGDKPYDCEHCGRKFRQWGDLRYHITSIHSNEKQYQCEYCGKEFARKYSLVVHRRIHTGERNYKCEYCGKSFRASSYLQNHRKIHTGEKPHHCSICSKPFRVRSDMKRHEKTHGKGASQKWSKPLKVHKSEVEENDESNELHIGEEEEATDHILGEYAQPDGLDNMGTMGISKRNLYTNGHELFLVTYPNELAPRSTAETTANWIQATNS